MTAILEDRSFQISIVLTLIFFLTGILFYFMGIAELGWILFLLLPIVLGISIGALPNRRWALVGAILATISLLVGLFTLGVTGFICIIYSIPIILPVICLGSVVTHLIDRYKAIKTENLPILLLPLLPFLIAAPIEHALTADNKNVVTVRSEQVFTYTPEQVYDVIKSVDTLDADKPFLMYLDLPVPTKCVLEKEEVGGIRTCYFKGGNFSRNNYGGGTITERITQLEPGKVLKMDVIDYTLVGRDWLGFKEAIYYFDKVGDNHCKLTRITTYTSETTPRFYWEPLEKHGIRQEHEYVFNNLEKDLNLKYSK
jgi:hypothetical protein